MQFGRVSVYSEFKEKFNKVQICTEILSNIATNKGKYLLK